MPTGPDAVTAEQRRPGGRPILLVAREPDETLRTYLPLLAELRRRDHECLVLFHHRAGGWAREQLDRLGVPWREVALPARGPSGLGVSLAELVQLWRTRRLAARLVSQVDPAAVVVIQDTLLLERFLVREANRRGRQTLVVQWAFTFPQATYDLLNRIMKAGAGDRRGAVENGRGSVALGLAAVVRRFRGGGRLRRLLGVSFDLVNSYGGGEAKVFAVMGEAFKEQFLAQGVRKERIVPTGHPLHDAAFAERARLTPERSAELKAKYVLPTEARVVLYATQPVLWRQVVSREQLLENVRALGEAVAALGPNYRLVLKLHPRELLEDYAPVADGSRPITLLKDGEIAELIGLAEVFISSSSSTVLLAMMLDRPIVTVNFNQVPHFDYFESVGGTLHVKTHAGAAEALRLATRDAATRQRLAAERTAVLARYARFDGRATERLADLVEKLAFGSYRTGGSPDEASPSDQVIAAGSRADDA